MTEEEAERILETVDGPVAEALGWALQQYQMRHEELEEDQGVIRMLRRRLANADKLVQTINPDIVWLDEEERFAVEKLPPYERMGRFIGGWISGQQLFLICGNMERIVVHLNFFMNDVAKPDFSQFKIIDYGSTVAFGEDYAASNYGIFHSLIDEHTESCCKLHGCTHDDTDNCTVYHQLTTSKPCDAASPCVIVKAYANRK